MDRAIRDSIIVDEWDNFDIHLIVNVDGVIEAASKKYCDLVGIPEKDIVGKSLLSRLHTDDKDNTESVFLDGELKNVVVNRHLKVDGSSVKIAWLPLFNKVQGKLTGVGLVYSEGLGIQDLSKDKTLLTDGQVEKILSIGKQTRRFYEEASYNLILEADGTIFHASGLFTEHLGYTNGDLRGINYVDMLHRQDVKGTRLAYEMGIQEHGHTPLFVNRWRRKDGSYLAVAWTPFMVQVGDYVYSQGCPYKGPPIAYEARSYGKQD